MTAASKRRCTDERGKMLRARVRHVLAEAKQSQLDVEELRKIVDEELARLER